MDQHNIRKYTAYIYQSITDDQRSTEELQSTHDPTRRAGKIEMFYQQQVKTSNISIY